MNLLFTVTVGLIIAFILICWIVNIFRWLFFSFVIFILRLFVTICSFWTTTTWFASRLILWFTRWRSSTFFVRIATICCISGAFKCYCLFWASLTASSTGYIKINGACSWTTERTFFFIIVDFVIWAYKINKKKK